MPDDIDILQHNRDMENDAHVKTAARAAKSIAAGEPGACWECGEESKRLVRGRCAPCRDELGLP